MDVTLRWGIGYETTIRNFVNIIATPKGGTHTAGFRAGACCGVMRKHLADNARKYKVGNIRLKDDVWPVPTAVLTVRLAGAAVEGQ